LVDESNISAHTDSYLEMNDLTINIERAYFYNDVNSFSLGNSNLSMNNVTIDVNSVYSFGFDVIRVTNYSDVSLDDVHVDLAGEAEGMTVSRSNVTISNSSFTGMSHH